MAQNRHMFPHDESLERLPAADREKRLLKNLQQLIKYAYRNAPGFKARLEAAGLKPADIRGPAGMIMDTVLKNMGFTVFPAGPGNTDLQMQEMREQWMEALRKDFQETCRVRFDRVEYLPAGSIPQGAKKIADKRVY